MIYQKASQIIINGLKPIQGELREKPDIPFEEIISNKLKEA